MAATIPGDLAWEITKGHSATLVKRANGVQFSRDPLNLRNRYSRKNEGQIANKAIGVIPGKEGGVTLLIKKSDKHHQPATSTQTVTFGPQRSTRKTFAGIVNSTTKRNYRPDLRKDAVARASAIRKSQRPVKADKPTKARGVKAKKADESA
ncbi:ribosomal L28e protein family-domain-containing protein [Paraphoma chrysanthemicola]|uniref:Ribosomal L28e protein family-domain-containing protein n=1 Tax=Paraphoma chrysanthemicola TaxID=798071 RepID=A0A8K0R5T8_9PLEO|nr:ribosomal L28e protein family-domain-containing protein [Paraphoma chrysanthemicola]